MILREHPVPASGSVTLSLFYSVSVRPWSSILPD